MSLEKTAYIQSVINKNNLADTNATFAKMVQLLNKMTKNEGDTSTVAAINALTEPMPNLIVKMTDNGTLTKGSLAVVADDYVRFTGLVWEEADWINYESSVVSFLVDTTLVKGDSNKVYIVGADAKTATLPSSATVGAGVRYLFLNGGADAAYGFTISPNASDKIMGSIGSGDSKIILSGTDDKNLVNTKATAKNGDYIELISDGVNGWYIDRGAGIWTEESQTALSVVWVDNVADLEIAVANQIAGQFIHLMPGTYALTESLAIPLTADGGGLIGEGIVVINGAAAADEAIKINTAAATGTFEYTIGGGIEVKGGADKIALKIVNGSSTQKTIVYVNGTANFLDNGTGVAISAVNTGTGAVRLYVNGQGQGFDTMNITPKVADDRFTFHNISIDENLVAASVAVAATFFFANCKIPHAGITGGNATNVIGFVGCWTEEVAYVPVAVDASDTPDGFSGTIL